MEFRLADLDDLPQLKKVYKDIIQKMNEQNIEIWDEIYPCKIFNGPEHVYYKDGGWNDYNNEEDVSF